MNKLKLAAFFLVDNFIVIVCVGLVIFSIYQQKQLNALNAELEKEEQPKIAIISFDDTVNSWAELDPSGKLGRKAISRAVNVYNKAGYLILDANAVIGDKGFAEFINITPKAVQNNSAGGQRG